MLPRLSASELTEWQAFYILEEKNRPKIPEEGDRAGP